MIALRLVLLLAWRSFLRHRRRSLITGAAIALSLASMLIFVGLAADAHDRMAETGIQLDSANILVQGRGYQDTQTLDHLVSDPAMVIAAARSLPVVTAAVPRVHSNGLLAAGETSTAVMVAGVAPSGEPAVSEIPRHLVAGLYLRTRAEMPLLNQPADIVVGSELARTMNLAVGDRTVLTLSPRGSRRPTSAAFLVRGIFRTGVSELDGFYVQISLGEAQRLLDLGQQVTQVGVFVRELDQTTGATRVLRSRLPEGVEVVPWQQALKPLYDAIVFDSAGLYLMMAIIFIIVAVGIFNTVLMSVAERTREFGVMMALGTAPGRIFGMVLGESVILALAAAGAGLAIGLGVHALIAHYGIDITRLAGSYQISGVVLEGRIYSRLDVQTVASWTLVVVLMAVLSALYPALRAVRLRPVEAIHHV